MALDDMDAALRIQQTDEVKKNDHCKSEWQTVEMPIMTTNVVKPVLEAMVAVLGSYIITAIYEITAELPLRLRSPVFYCAVLFCAAVCSTLTIWLLPCKLSRLLMYERAIIASLILFCAAVFSS